MEKDGWLDQAILAVLGLLTTPWLSLSVAFVGGGVVAYLHRRSPEDDAGFLTEWPDRLFTGAFLLMASLKAAPRLVFPTYQFTCEHQVGAAGIPEPTSCSWAAEGTMGVVYDYTFGDFLREWFISLLQGAAVGLFGAGIGIALALVIGGGSQRAPAIPPQG